MKKFLKFSACLLGITFLSISFITIKDNFLHAQEEDETITYTADAQSLEQEVLNETDDQTDQEDMENNDAQDVTASSSEEEATLGRETTYTQDPTPDVNEKEILIRFDSANNTALNSITVRINDEEVTFTLNNPELVDNTLTLTLTKDEPMLITFVKATGTDDLEYQFDPSYLLLDMEDPDLKDTYNITALTGDDIKPVTDVSVTIQDKDQNIKDSFEHYETAYVEFNVTKPLTVLYYKLPDESQVHLYDGEEIAIKSSSDEAQTRKLEYTLVSYNPLEEKPDLDYDLSNATWSSCEINFKERDLENPVYQDEDGNIYSKDDVTLNIKDLTDIAPYEEAIQNFSEFKNIPIGQIVYLDIALYANDVEVQPDGSYTFTIPYPEGSSFIDDFVIYHFVSGNPDEAVNLNYTKRNEGLEVTVDSFSPFVIGWIKGEAEQQINNLGSSENRIGTTGAFTADTTNASVLYCFCIFGALMIAYQIKRKVSE